MAFASLVSGSLMLILFIVLVCVCAFSSSVPAWFGYLAMAACVLSLAGFIFAATAFKERDVYQSIPIAAMAVNGITFLIYVITYILGIK